MSTSSRFPTVSVIINTDGRAKALQETINGLRHLDYPNFEVCVVCGPTPDGTREYAATLAGQAKVMHCPERNLSQSRNIGIAAAAGEIVAFIDDDGIPEPEWLDQLVVPYADPEVGGAGGLVYDHTGYEFQYEYAGCDRLGNAITDAKEPFSENNYPLASVFPYIQGTNSSFRRDAAVQIGGFDEEIEFYLDETDVCCRLVDQGFSIAQLPNAYVHHKFLPSSIRNSDRVTVKKFAVLKNKIYFSLMANKGHKTMHEVVVDNLRFIDGQRSDIQFHVGAGRLTFDDIETYDADADRAWRVGLTRGLSGQRKTRPATYFDHAEPFLRFPTLKPDGGKKTIVLLSQTYLPATSNGIARYTHDIAQALGAKGHNVHVLTRGEDYNRVDLEGDAWVHRIVPKAQDDAPVLSDGPVPSHIWNYSATMLEEIDRIAQHRPIDVVEAVSWDCEGIAILRDGRYACAVNVVTSLSNWLETHSAQREDAEWMSSFGKPMLATEKQLFEESPSVIAASKAIVDALQQAYDLEFGGETLSLCPHGMLDMEPLPRQRPAVLGTPSGRKAVLFVGRLELRKGIDVLLEAATDILADNLEVEFWIAGKNDLILDGGETAKALLETRLAGSPLLDRIRFLGEVTEEELAWLYANCDVFVAPSRFESFGLIFVEAGMFSRPVIGCDAGGMAEVVQDGVTGLLVPPGDAGALRRALERLLGDESERVLMGKSGRSAFEARYAANVIADRRLEIYDRISRRPVSKDHWQQTGDAPQVEFGRGRSALHMTPGQQIRVPVSDGAAHLTFFRHAWSGEVEIGLNENIVATVDLFSEQAQFWSLRIPVPKAAKFVTITRPGRKSTNAHDSEVLLAQVSQSLQ